MLSDLCWWNTVVIVQISVSTPVKVASQVTLFLRRYKSPCWWVFPRPKSVPSMTFPLYCPWMKSLLSDPTLFLHHMHCHLLVIVPTSFCLIPIPKVIRVHCLFACLLTVQAILDYTSLVGTSSATAVHISFLRLNQYSLFNEVSSLCFRKRNVKSCWPL